jgi:N-acetylmuramic acid 6-phosphate etherase
MSKWASLLTEQRNPATEDIDTLSTLELVDIINKEDAKIIPAIASQLPQIAQAVDRVTQVLLAGGRLFYLGAGTSGRLGILDASECPPTFSVSPDLVQGLIAGGPSAVFQAVEGAEDNPSGAISAFKERGLSSNDLVMGIAASGVTPYVLGGIAYARQLGCGTLYFTCSPSAASQVEADIKIIPAVGPEVITGSTRMKAGTATKLVLNMISSGAMIKLGKTYSNLMVDLQPKNAKLKDRSIRILTVLADLQADQAEALLDKASDNLKLALIMALCSTDLNQAQRLHNNAQGHVRKAVADFLNAGSSPKTS